MKKSILLLTLVTLVSGNVFGQNGSLTFRSYDYEPNGVSLGHSDSKSFCYYLYFSPVWGNFPDDEKTTFRMIMQFDVHVDEKSYDQWVDYTKKKYQFTNCTVMDVKVKHKDGTEEVYTFEGFKKYLWP